MKKFLLFLMFLAIIAGLAYYFLVLKGGPKNQTFTVNGVSFTMVGVKGGTFTMGVSPDQASSLLLGNAATGAGSSVPAHQVTVSDFYIGETEVTQMLWNAVMGSIPGHFQGKPDHPVSGATWNQCQAFIEKLNELTGKQFRMLTEAEWEFAALGGNKSQGYKYAGSDNIDEVAWYFNNSFKDYCTRPVAYKKPNELGIYDMTGNVHEWCQDWYGVFPESSKTNPTGPPTGVRRVARGGGWDSKIDYCVIKYRYSAPPTFGSGHFGLRLALSCP